MSVDRSWMYKRVINNEANPEFANGVREFIAFAVANSPYPEEDKIKCPCKNCANRCYLKTAVVRMHLASKGFIKSYERWTFHGETNQPDDNTHPSVNINDNEEEREPNVMSEMVVDAVGPEFDWTASEEPPNAAAKNFYQMLKDSEEPLWEAVNSCSAEVSKLCTVTELLNLKADYHLPQSCMNRMLSIMKKALPANNKLPKDFYQCKKMVKGLGMAYEKIHACPNDCMLYYGSNEEKTVCDECGHSRYKENPNPNGKLVPHKVLRYFPIAPRLQRLYLCPAIAEHMRWHKMGVRVKPGMMVHPADGQAWKEFDLNHVDFAQDSRNVRLGLSTDGFTPFGIGGPSYSCWPVFITPYNLPPSMITQPEYTFLTLIIPGPSHPGKKIDIYLQPLIDELKVLWSEGIETFDSFYKENFQMRVSVMWTISDFPAYGMLSGWSTHGNLSCPICMGETKSTRLKHGRKPCWFDCHRQFLPEDHPLRDEKNRFKRNTIEKDLPPPRLTGSEILETINEIDFNSTRVEGFGVDHNWTKKSIFWELPYWSTNLLRHNLDVMHIENNWFGNAFPTIMDIRAKTKDTNNARRDMATLCDRPDLELIDPDSSNPSKPRAIYTLDIDKKRAVFQWLKDLKFPDGYASNWARRVNVDDCKVTGLKSHDGHIFMERLLPVAFRDLIPEDMWEALTEVSNFFRDLCAKEIDPAHMEELARNIVVTMCKLEMFLPPGFFDCMEHLVVHLAYEAKIGGPITFRWMYLYERLMKELRMKVGNKAHAEGSIAEAYLVQEISTFCALYFSEDVRTRLNNQNRNFVEHVINDTRLNIFTYPGRTIGHDGVRDLTDEEHKVAHYYVLINCKDIDPFVEKYDNELRRENPRILSRTLYQRRKRDFANWLRNLVLADLSIDDRIRDLVKGPSKRVTCYNGYLINGYRFHTKKYGVGKRTTNSGVCVLADGSMEGNIDYYGFIEEIIELRYHGTNNNLILFNCHWFDIDNGVRVDKKHGLVEVRHTSSLRKYDPFVMAWQVNHQVYYLPYVSKKRERRDWWVAMKTMPRWKALPISSSISSNPLNVEPQIFQEEGTTCPFEVTTDMPTIFEGEQSRLVIDGASHDNEETEIQDDNSYDDDYDEYGRRKRQRIDNDEIINTVDNDLDNDLDDDME